MTTESIDHSPLVATDGLARGLADAATGAGVVPVYQPIVSLDSMAVVAYEALARWPGTTGATPDLVFAAAARNGTTAALDRACRRAAVAGARARGLDAGTALFVNVEPDGVVAADRFEEVTAADFDREGLTVVLELTERNLLASPAKLLRAVHVAREAGCRIALDDVGADPDSLALLDLVRPDVIKLDLSLVQRTPGHEQARTLAGVMACAERTGAAILAEGIETPAHFDQAVACGASLGQGWLLGRPAPAPLSGADHGVLSFMGDLTTLVPTTPAQLFDGTLQPRIAAKHWLTALSRHVEAQGLQLADPPVVLTALQESKRFTRATRLRYRELADASPLVAVFGADMPVSPEGSVRGVALADDDPLRDEWTVVVLGTQTAAALIAQDLGDTGPDAERRFRFSVTYDRHTVTRAARSLVDRLIT